MMRDNVYGKRTSLQHQYDQLDAQSAFQELRDRTIAALDDNDLMDESGTSTETALKFFEETFQPNLASEIAGTHQVYQWEDHLQIIVLDVRSFGTQSAVRDSDEEDDDELVSMLGDEQWKWFEQRVESVSSDALQIVVSPIQILATGHSFDCWNRIPNERRRLLDLLSSHHVLLLSGDRHMSALYHSQAQMSDQSKDD